MILEQFSNPSRIFQYDYIYIDTIFLLVWLVILLYNRKYTALLFGLVIAPILYFIDAYVWWNGVTNSGIALREYWIGGTVVSHPTGSLIWQKFGADFMMTISYALFTFPWLVILFENIKRPNWKTIVKYTSVFFGFWLLTPLLSATLPINDTVVETIRHTGTQIWLVNLLIGYGILLAIYWREPNTVGKVFLVGMVGALIMEVPLFIFGIRPTGFIFILLEAIFLLNQGVPYLFLLWDKALPKLKRKL